MGVETGDGPLPLERMLELASEVTSWTACFAGYHGGVDGIYLELTRDSHRPDITYYCLRVTCSGVELGYDCRDQRVRELYESVEAKVKEEAREQVRKVMNK